MLWCFFGIAICSHTDCETKDKWYEWEIDENKRVEIFYKYGVDTFFNKNTWVFLRYIWLNFSWIIIWRRICYSFFHLFLCVRTYGVKSNFLSKYDRKWFYKFFWNFCKSTYRNFICNRFLMQMYMYFLKNGAWKIWRKKRKRRKIYVKWIIHKYITCTKFARRIVK